MNLKPFDLERALAGDPVIIDGDTGVYKLTNIHRKGVKRLFQFTMPSGDQAIMTYMEGEGWSHGFLGDKYYGEAFMAPVKHQEWVRVFKLPNGIFTCSSHPIEGTKEEMDTMPVAGGIEYMGSVKIHEWEE